MPGLADDAVGLDLVARLLDYSPQTRISVEEALNHTWLEGIAAEVDARDLDCSRNLLGGEVEVAAAMAVARLAAKQWAEGAGDLPDPSIGGDNSEALHTPMTASM